MNFTQWLAKQTERDTPLGDLARDAAEDGEWPTAGTILAVFEEHLRRRGACEDAQHTLTRAWRSYRQARRQGRLGDGVAIAGAKRAR